MGKNKSFVIIGIIIALLASCVGGYMYYKRTPTYTLNIIKESVEKHDYETFSKHVDTENIISCAYDDVMETAMEEDPLDANMKSFASGLIQMMKPSIVSSFNDAVKQYVKTGSTEPSTTETANKEEQVGQNAVNNFNDEVDVEKIKFKGINTSRQDGDFSIITIIIENTQLNKEFHIDLKARQLDDGTWQILQVSNLKDCIREERKAKEEKLAEINAPIKAEIQQRISLQKPVAEIVNGDPWGISKLVRIDVIADINSDKVISKIAGDIIFNNNDDVFKMPYEIPVNANSGSKELVMGCELNPFKDNDSKLIKDNFNGYSVDTTIDKIIYDDGSTLELKKQLKDI